MSAIDNLTSLIDLSKVSKVSKLIELEIMAKKITATELKVKTGEYLQVAQKEPVEIQRNGRTVAVLISYEEYEHLNKVEDVYWLKRARAAEKEGFIGVEASEKFIREQLKKLKLDA